MNYNIADLFESVTDAVPERTALVCGDRRLRYDELDARANRLAHFLASQGVGAGDQIGLYLQNGTEYVEAMLAAFKLRAVPVNINFRYVTEELRYLCRDARVKGLLFNRAAAPRGATPDASSKPMAGPCFSMKSATCRWHCRPACCACWHRASSSASVVAS